VDLAAERVDIACRVGPPRDPDLIARKVTSSRIVTCASPHYLSEFGIPRTPEELRKHRLIGYLRDASRPSDWQFKSGKGTTRLKLPMALSFNTAEPLTLCAMEGQGIVQQVDLLCARAIADGKLVEILREYSCEGPAMNIVYPRATQHLAKVRVFAEFAAELLLNYEARMKRAIAPG
jgi:LysR family transcriptional regulator for bpeEF and oprC